MADWDCNWESVVCPIEACVWSGREARLYVHFQESHKDVVVYNGNNYVWLAFKPPTRNSCKILLFWNKKNFLLDSNVCVQNNEQGNILVSVQLIGRKTVEVDYQFQIKWLDNGNKIIRESSWHQLNSIQSVYPYFTNINAEKPALLLTTQTTKMNELVKFSENVLRMLECPCCLETTNAPILQCENGHLLCNDCRPKVEKCPLCASTAFFRNLFAENIAESRICNCKYKTMGCGYVCAMKTLEEHENKCLHKDISCLEKGCDWKQAINTLYEHICEKHESMVIENNCATVSLENYRGEDTTHNFILHYDRVLFAVLIELRKDYLSCVVKVIGPFGNDDSYECTFTIPSKQGRNVCKRSERCIDYVNAEKYVDCSIRYPINLIYKLVDQNYNLNFRVDIVKIK